MELIKEIDLLSAKKKILGIPKTLQMFIELQTNSTVSVQNLCVLIDALADGKFHFEVENNVLKIYKVDNEKDESKKP